MPLLRSRLLSATASLAAAALLGATLAAVPASAAPDAVPAVDGVSAPTAVGPETEGGTEPATGEPSPSASQPDAGTEAAAVDRFIVKFADDAGRTAAVRADAYDQPAEGLGTEVAEVRATGTGAHVVTTDRELDPDEAADLVADLEADPAIEYAEPDRLLKPAASTPNDTEYGLQWDQQAAPSGMNVPAAWEYSHGEGVVVAVVDTGITNHSDLNANVLPGYDMISDPDVSRDGNGRDADPHDNGDWYDAGYCGDPEDSSESSWHGTHVAGVIAAVADNGKGIAGVAPGAKILPVRALGSCGGYTSDIADAVIWAAGGAVGGAPTNTTPAGVINLSLGGYAEDGLCPQSFQDAVDTAYDAGSVLVAAAGNETLDARYSTPANCDHVIAVAASDRYGKLATYSNFGALIDVTAPGGEITYDAKARAWKMANGIRSTSNTGSKGPGAENYAYSDGTSSAAPHVAGLAALLLSARPDLPVEEVELRLKAATRAISGTCVAGIVDAPAALAAVNDPAPGAFTAGVPSITGTRKVGATLTAVSGTWAPAPAAYGYQWYRNGTAVGSATGSRYTLTAADYGKKISVCVTATATGRTAASSPSTTTGTIAKGTLAGATPTIGGTRKVGSTLTAKTGTWTAGTKLAYQWYRSGTRITNATKSTYKLAGADAGKRITVKVTGRKDGYTTLSRTAAKTGAIAKGTLRTDTPTISGTRKVGSTLVATAGTWTSGTTLGYRWFRSGDPIAGATKSTYRLAKADRNRTIKVRVTGTKTGYTTARMYSKATARIR